MGSTLCSSNVGLGETQRPGPKPHPLLWGTVSSEDGERLQPHYGLRPGDTTLTACLGLRAAFLWSEPKDPSASELSFPEERGSLSQGASEELLGGGHGLPQGHRWWDGVVEGKESSGEDCCGGGKMGEQMCQVCDSQDPLQLNYSAKILLLREAKRTPRYPDAVGVGNRLTAPQTWGPPQSVRPHPAQTDDERRPHGWVEETQENPSTCLWIGGMGEQPNLRALSI